jgi:hypothetical protein
LEGEYDNGQIIKSEIMLSQVSVDSKPRDVWVKGRSSGPMIVTIAEDEEGAEEGRVEYLFPTLGIDRAKVPRGMDPTYLQIGIKNDQGVSFDLDSIEVFGEILGKRKSRG